MNDEKLRNQLGANIVVYRKRSGLTQAKLAQQLNYSDKAVSKWERGESIPDVVTLVQLAELFGVTVDELLRDPNALPDHNGVVVEKMGKAVEKTIKRKANKNIILMLSSTLVWFVALFVFVVLSSLNIHKSALAFFYAIPINAIVLLSLRSAWHDFRGNKAYVSLLVWGCLLAIYMTLWMLLSLNIWKIFLLGIPGQLAIFLWFRLYRKSVPEERNG